jgi:hypothetical protein
LLQSLSGVIKKKKKMLEINNLLVLLASMFLLVLVLKEKTLALSSIFIGALVLVVLFTGLDNLLKIGFIFLLLLLWLYKIADGKTGSQKRGSGGFGGRYFIILGVCVVALLSSPMTTLVEANNHQDGNPVVPPPQVVDFVESVGKIERQPTIDVLGTHYVVGDDGLIQAWLREGMNPVEEGVCYANVLYPNTQEYFIENQLMSASEINFFEGFHFYHFVVPNVTGVYPVNVYCNYDITRELHYVDYDYGNLTRASEGSQNIATLNHINNIYYVLEGDKDFCQNSWCEQRFHIHTHDTGWFSTFLEDARITYRGYKDAGNKNIFFEVYNENLDQWISWFTMTGASGTIYDEQFIINESFDGVEHIEIRMRVFDLRDKQFIWSDGLYLTKIYNGTFVEDLRGGQEIVVSKGLSEAVTNINEPSPVVNDSLFPIIFFGLIFFLLLTYSLYVFASLSGVLLALSLLEISSLLTLGMVFLSLMIFLYGVSKKKE